MLGPLSAIIEGSKRQRKPRGEKTDQESVRTWLALVFAGSERRQMERVAGEKWCGRRGVLGEKKAGAVICRDLQGSGHEEMMRRFGG
jgi:hypothetical protein